MFSYFEQHLFPFLFWVPERRRETAPSRAINDLDDVFVSVHLCFSYQRGGLLSQRDRIRLARATGSHMRCLMHGTWYRATLYAQTEDYFTS